MKILIVPGDGIGPEVMREGKKLLHAIAQKFASKLTLTEVDWGAERFLCEGVGIPKDVKIEELPKNYDAILFGALGDPRIPDMAHGREILLGLRFGLDLFINMRPVKLLSPVLNVLKDCKPIDIMIFRENTEDIYLGLGKALHEGTKDEVTIDESKHTFLGVERIIQSAFDYAIKNKRQKITLVDKSNAIRFGGRLWQRVFISIAKKYPTIKADHLFVDVAALQMVQNPSQFNVIVTSNLFGDILSDLGAGLVGGLGLLASANIHPQKIALFEPVHGSAPDIVGKNIANPFAMFLSIAMMMDYFGYDEAASFIEQSIIKAIEAHKTTPDLGGKLSTIEASDYIIEACMRS